MYRGKTQKSKKQMKRGRNAPAFAVSGIRDDVSYEVVFEEKTTQDGIRGKRMF